MTVSLAWRNAVALTNSRWMYGDYFEKTGFVERLPIELVARFQIDYRPSAKVSMGTGFGMKNADPVPGNMLRAFVERIWDACKAGELSYVRESHQLLGEDVLMIASQDFAKWLATNEMLPSEHIQAWFDETGVTFGKAKPVKEKPLATSERNSLLLIIAALCKEANIDYTKPAKAAGQILHTADIMRLQIGETTIERHLKRIPDAVGARMK
ncbi:MULTISPECIES: hypothetical protein [Giesbergeria]|uniref:Uncharacterized protein n=1 Tax=Giesbergeria sinuosa TaxID=80883 RepID=A0ABV9QD16_9BURK